MIIGIDPGLAKTGFGVIKGSRYAGYGIIITPSDEPLHTRLGMLFENLTEVIDKCQPDELAIERLFFSRNVSSAIEVSHARGVILLAASEYDLNVFEYTPNQVKKAVTGSGRADKKQVQKMVKMMLKIDCDIPDDTADALAIALCHAHSKVSGEGAP
uniref:Crossover junction endodeoxyribonuclease RuvC n=1 Tax=Candidatus Methanogaster sp. ANME-2c ERB4 TaxID=2759911 RepID=A0A7G9YM32_9EURY|nr:crossover junction endodeoxyribonuclease RuvC [Methanosarcinales archaeon ANME-2c ERB4]